MSDPLLALLFLLAGATSLASSWVLVTRLEQVGTRLRLSEALLGMLAALAADAPEITAAVAALGAHQAGIGAGVVIGSNVFNLAALLGLSALVAGRIVLHRRVILLEGFVAVWTALLCVAVVAGLLPAGTGLGLELAVFLPYLAILASGRDRLRRLGVPTRWAQWLAAAVVEEEGELRPAVRRPRGRARDAVVASVAVLVVVGASVVMERAAELLGTRHSIPGIVTGGLVLAIVTSLPNAVAAVYLASRGMGAAMLSTAMNSNALNVAVGLLVPAVLVGIRVAPGQTELAAWWYLGMATCALGAAYYSCGLSRQHGWAIVCGYLSFAGAVVATAYSSSVGMLLSGAPLAVACVGLTLAAMRRRDAGMRSARRGADDESLLAGWSVASVSQLALLLSATIAVIDAALGPRAILIGLLIVGPCCAVLTGRWRRTAAAGGWAIALAIVLGLPDGIWGSSTHLVFMAAVTIVAGVSTSSAAVIERRR